MEDVFISAKDQFDAKHGRTAWYMPIPQTQHPPKDEHGVHMVPCKHLIAMNFPIGNWTVRDATFGAAQPSEFARENVSLFLLVIQWALTAHINVYVETLYDDVLAQAGMLDERGKRLFIPVPEAKYQEFAMAVMASLNPQEETRPAKRRKTKSAPKVKVTQDQDAYDSYVSKKLVANESKFLQVMNRMWMCQVAEGINEINFDMVDSAGQGGDDGMESDDAIPDKDTIFGMLDHTRIFNSVQSLEWYDESRLPEWQRTASSYFDAVNGMFMVKPETYETYDITMRMLRPTDGFLGGDADNLRDFMQQTVEVPMSRVRDKLCELGRACGFRKRDEYSRLSDVETLDLFTKLNGPGGKPYLKDFSHCARIEAPDAFAVSQGLTFSKQAEFMITPISAKMKEDFLRRRKHVHQRVATGMLQADEIDRVDSDIAEAVFDMLENECSGVPPMYHRVWEERKTLRRKLFPSDMDDDTDVARMARSMFFFDTVSISDIDQQNMAFEDRLYCSYADILATHLNATPFQARIILKCKTYCSVLLRNVFGPQSGVCMQGTCDVGKSHCAQTLTCMFPACQVTIGKHCTTGPLPRHC